MQKSWRESGRKLSPPAKLNLRRKTGTEKEGDMASKCFSLGMARGVTSKRIRIIISLIINMRIQIIIIMTSNHLYF